LREIHKASGGPWGGIYVDRSYFEWLKAIFGERAINEICSDVDESLDMQREFEVKKRDLKSNSNTKIVFRIPSKLRELSLKYEEKPLKELISAFQSKFGAKVDLVAGDKLRVDPSVLLGCMDVPLTSIIEHVAGLFKEPNMQSVNTLILVGGFGESNYVYERMRTVFPDKQVQVPKNAGLSVLKGAAVFGHSPDLVSSRVARYTYGVALDQRFHEGLSKQRTVLVGNENVTMGCFKKIVVAGEEIKFNAEVSHEFTANSSDYSHLEIFQSTTQNPFYVDEPGCSKLGDLVVHHHGKGKGYSIVVTFLFGKTELMVKYRVKETGKEEFLKINCL